MYEGSGGGSINSTAGSGGGGLVWLSLLNHLRINNTQINADGENGQKNNALFGSGGGSGGSIQILAKHLDGNGNLSVSGGNGSLGGGGGSGGRIVMHFLGNYLSDFQSQHTINWLGNLDIQGGQSGDKRSSSNGTEWHP